MHWIKNFQLFLFDFDGLLVNTEHLQFQAYVNALAKKGYALDLSFGEFCELAHLNATALKDMLYIKFPDLDPNWELFHREKRNEYLSLLQTGKVELMPGAEALLTALSHAKIRHVVVTHSPLIHIQAIRAQHPVLQAIPFWITREEYLNPKPNPECYLRAIQLHGQPGDRIIGFEDSFRGFQALQGTPALPVLICSEHHPLLDIALTGDILHFDSLNDVHF